LAQALSYQPDVAVISNPTALHLDVAIPAAEAGCHLFIEKPISNTMDRVQQLMEVVDQKELICSIGFQFRFHPGLRLVKELLEGGRIGKPVSARAHWGEYLPNWHAWEDYRQSYSARPELGGGVVLTLCHPFDYLHWYFGEAQSVFARVGRQGELQIDVEDSANVLLEYSNGFTASVYLDYLQQPPAHWLEIIGTTGTIHWDYHEGYTKIFRNDQGRWEKFNVPSDFERNHMFLHEMRHFLASITKDAKPMNSLSDGIVNLQIALAVLNSGEQNVPIDPKSIH
jgi:predicted dehydrogenase